MSRQVSRNGAAVVEFAVVVPLLFFIFAAVIELSRMMLLQQTADTAAYEGARHGMVPGATAEEAFEAAQRLIRQSNLAGTRIIVEPPEITESTGAISVSVSIPLSENYWFLKFWNNYTVESNVTLICERVPLVQLTGLPKLKGKPPKQPKPPKDEDDDDDD